MSDLILHQYADSPFSEKIRALLGFRKRAHQRVEIPAIMPKPELTALTGGYRRTPVMQRGADIYCDTALIAEIIEGEQTSCTVFDSGNPALSIAAARWADSELFRVCVGLVFQPAAIAANPRFSNPGDAEAFMKDRAAFSAGSAGLITPLPRAEAVFREHLARLNQSLETRAYLGGDSPDIADFSHWHCCWFVYRQTVLKHYFEPFAAVSAWLQRMQDLSSAAPVEVISGQAAVEIAARSDPAAISDPQIDARTKLSAGQRVRVLPTDYGFQPVEGELLRIDGRMISLSRQDDRAGRVHVHFPRYGFDASAI